MNCKNTGIIKTKIVKKK